MSGTSEPPFPPSGPVTLGQNIPSYVYVQYSDDDAIQTFVAAQNVMAQWWVDWWQFVSLPVYSGLSGTLLDWVGQGLYGYARPSLSFSQTSGAGPYASYPYDTYAYNTGSSLVIQTFGPMNDDQYKRALTWHLYRGDGWQYSTDWLKKRIHRFLNGANGLLTVNDNTMDVSVAYDTSTSITITVPNSTMGHVFYYCVVDKVLSLPLDYTYEVTIGA